MPLNIDEARNYSPTVVMLERAQADEIEVLKAERDFLRGLIMRMVEKPPVIQVNP